MSSLKSHLTLVLSLIAILLSIFLFRIFSQIMNLYQKNIVNNYSIVIVSTKPITSLNISEISSINPININSEIKRLKEKYKNIDFSNLKIPFFYKLKLKNFPSPTKLQEIQKQLKNYTFIKKIMTKSSSQTKIYNLLMLLKTTTKIFMFLIAILGFLLIIKQLEVWKLLHYERMYIMELFGAPVWFKGAALFKIAFLDSIISLILTIGLIFLITNSALFNNIINELNINFQLNYFNEIILLLITSFLISFISSIIVVIGKK